MRITMEKIVKTTFELTSCFVLVVLFTSQNAGAAEMFHCVSGNKTIRQNYEICKRAASDSGLTATERAGSAYRAGIIGTMKAIDASSAEVLGYLLTAQEGGIQGATLQLADIYKDGYKDIQKNFEKASSLYESIIASGRITRSYKKALLARAEMRLQGHAYASDPRAIENDLLKAAAFHDPSDELDLSTIGRYYSDVNSPLHNRYTAYFWKYVEYKQAITPIFKGMFYKDLEEMSAVLERKHVDWIIKEVDQETKFATIVLPSKVKNYVKEQNIK